MFDALAQYYMMNDGDWAWGWLMMFFWLALIVLIAVFVIRATSHGNDGSPANSEDALTIAKNRYAKGEISKQEFEQLKKDLGSK